MSEVTLKRRQDTLAVEPELSPGRVWQLADRTSALRRAANSPELTVRMSTEVEWLPAASADKLVYAFSFLVQKTDRWSVSYAFPLETFARLPGDLERELGEFLLISADLGKSGHGWTMVWERVTEGISQHVETLREGFRQQLQKSLRSTPQILEGDFVDWTLRIENPPRRATRTIELRFVHAGRNPPKIKSNPLD